MRSRRQRCSTYIGHRASFSDTTNAANGTNLTWRSRIFLEKRSDDSVPPGTICYEHICLERVLSAPGEPAALCPAPALEGISRLSLDLACQNKILREEHMKTNEGCGAAPQQISLVDGAFTLPTAITLSPLLMNSQHSVW